MSTEQLALEDYRDQMIEAARSSGEQAARSGIADDWSDAAWREIHRLAQTGRQFSADDVTSAIGSAPSPGACGAVFRAAAGTGLIVCVGVQTSKRIQRHGGIQRLWAGAERGT